MGGEGRILCLTHYTSVAKKRHLLGEQACFAVRSQEAHVLKTNSHRLVGYLKLRRKFTCDLLEEIRVLLLGRAPHHGADGGHSSRMRPSSKRGVLVIVIDKWIGGTDGREPSLTKDS